MYVALVMVFFYQSQTKVWKYQHLITLVAPIESNDDSFHRSSVQFQFNSWIDGDAVRCCSMLWHSSKWLTAFWRFSCPGGSTVFNGLLKIGRDSWRPSRFIEANVHSFNTVLSFLSRFYATLHDPLGMLSRSIEFDYISGLFQTFQDPLGFF